MPRRSYNAIPMPYYSHKEWSPFQQVHPVYGQGLCRLDVSFLNYVIKCYLYRFLGPYGKQTVVLTKAQQAKLPRPIVVSSQPVILPKPGLQNQQVCVFSYCFS